MSSKHPIIVYHADCIDGAASAWIATQALGVETAATVFIPYDHAEAATAEDAIRTALKTGGAIYFADITPEKHLLDEMRADGRDIHILDHHASSIETLDGRKDPNLHIVFDPAAPSAAKMIWTHFFPTQEPPAVIALIDLMDGAANGLKTPEDFAAAALVDAQNIKTPDRAFAALRGLAKLNFNDMAQKGAPLAEEQSARIDRLFEKTATARLQILPDGKPRDVPIVNGDIRRYGRQISERLVNMGKDSGANAAFMWALQKNGTVSLCIRTSGSPEASAIAKHLCALTGATGGGHRDAAAVHFASLADFMKHVKIKRPPSAPDIRPEPPSPF